MLDECLELSFSKLVQEFLVSLDDLNIEPIMDVSGLWNFLFLLYVLRVLLGSLCQLGDACWVLVRLVILWLNSPLYTGQVRGDNGWLLEDVLCDISVRVIN